MESSKKKGPDIDQPLIIAQLTLPFLLFSLCKRKLKKWKSVETFWHTFRGNQKWTHDKIHPFYSSTENLGPEIWKGKS